MTRDFDTQRTGTVALSCGRAAAGCAGRGGRRAHRKDPAAAGL